MAKIWADCLVSGSKTWTDVPQRRRAAVKAELDARAARGELDAERVESLTTLAALMGGEL